MPGCFGSSCLNRVARHTHWGRWEPGRWWKLWKRWSPWRRQKLRAGRRTRRWMAILKRWRLWRKWRPKKHWRRWKQWRQRSQGRLTSPCCCAFHVNTASGFFLHRGLITSNTQLVSGAARHFLPSSSETSQSASQAVWFMCTILSWLITGFMSTILSAPTSFIWRHSSSPTNWCSSNDACSTCCVFHILE